MGNAILNNFHFCIRKDRCGHEKASGGFFLFNLSRRKVVRYFCFDLFSSAKWWYFQLPRLCKTCLTCQRRRNLIYFNVEIHKLQNFPRICSRGLNIFASYDLHGPITPYGNITPYGDRKSQLMGVWIQFSSSFNNPYKQLIKALKALQLFGTTENTVNFIQNNTTCW